VVFSYIHCTVWYESTNTGEKRIWVCRIWTVKWLSKRGVASQKYKSGNLIPSYQTKWCHSEFPRPWKLQILLTSFQMHTRQIFIGECHLPYKMPLCYEFPWLKNVTSFLSDVTVVLKLGLSIFFFSWLESRSGPRPPGRDTPHSVRLLWTSKRPVAETSTWQHTKHSERIWTSNPSKRAVADIHFRPWATRIGVIDENSNIRYISQL
jgi:hypothetical protein